MRSGVPHLSTHMYTPPLRRGTHSPLVCFGTGCVPLGCYSGNRMGGSSGASGRSERGGWLAGWLAGATNVGKSTVLNAILGDGGKLLSAKEAKGIALCCVVLCCAVLCCVVLRKIGTATAVGS